VANQVAARLHGDDYQHLTSWLHALELMRPRCKVRLVTIEDEKAGSADDVTVLHEPGTSKPDRFYQIKFHQTQGGAYSTASLVSTEGKGTSILQKLFATWQKLKQQRGEEPFQIRFVSNWSWDSNDKAGMAFSGRDNSVTDGFLSAGSRSDLGGIRQQWETHLGTKPEEFSSFVRTLHFDLGAACFDERVERVRDQMDNLSLQSDDAGLKIAVGIVREWIQRGVQEVTLDSLRKAIEDHGLAAPDANPCVTVMLTTVKHKRIDILPDYTLDWREHFDGPDYEKGHALKPGESWERDLLPELRAVEASIAEETSCRLIRSRGYARLSAWFAFGRTFSENAGYVIECDQQGQLWRSDAGPSTDFRLSSTKGNGDLVPVGPSSIAVGISITRDIEEDVRTYMQESQFGGQLVLLTPNRPLGKECLRSSQDAVAMAHQAKEKIRALTSNPGVKTVLLFYAGPLSGACFMGHSFNAMGAPVQVMEFQDPGYAPAFVL